MHPRPHRLVVPLALALACVARPAHAQVRFAQTNLVSSVPGLAKTLDASLINPWGISFGATSPFWVSDNGTGLSTLYNGAGVKQGLVVTIPNPGGSGPSTPTGQVFNATGAFPIGNGGNATFLFATQEGKIAGWNGAAGTTALIAVDQSAGGASYTGLAIAGQGASARLYAANFAAGTIDVFDGSFAQIPGGFVDPNLPAGYAPFNVQALGGRIYVAYALRGADGDEVPGPGNGFVDVFDANGNLQRRVASDGVLDAPWGLAIAPANFGSFGNALLVGNFGDGTIHAFDAATGSLLGQLLDPFGAPLVNDGLWGITPGNGGNGGSQSLLYFAAGIDGEADGLFGSLAPVPEPATLALVGTGLGVLAVAARWRRRTRG